MLLRSYILQSFLVLTLTVVGCVEPKVSKAPSAKSMAGPIQVRSADLAVALIRINEKGDKGTLIKEPGWREYVFEIENLSTNDSYHIVVEIDIPEEHRVRISDMLYNKFGIAGSTTSGLRLCPHIYNTEAHIDRVIAGVKEGLATIS